MTDGCDYVAPVEQCCLCPVGHIRYVVCGAVLPMASGAALQMYIFNVTQKCCRAIRAGFWPDCGRIFCWYGEMALELVCRAD